MCQQSPVELCLHLPMCRIVHHGASFDNPMLKCTCYNCFIKTSCMWHKKERYHFFIRWTAVVNFWVSLSLMSSCTIVGFFELRNWHPRSTDIKKSDGTMYKILHLHYNSDMICLKDMSLPAEIQQYMSMKELILCKNTAAFVVIKLCVPMGRGPTSAMCQKYFWFWMVFRAF